MARQRPGFPSIANLPPQLRQVLEPVLDVLNRVMLRGSLAKVKPIKNTVDENLASTAVLADVIVRVNEVAKATNTAIVKINEVIERLQED